MPAVDTTAQDDVLVLRTLAGEFEAYGTIVARHQDAAYRVARRIVGAADADDVVQDALLRAFHKLGDWRGEAPLRVWLLRVVHSTALNAVVKRRPEPMADLPDSGIAVAAAAQPVGLTPAAALEAGERRERLELKLQGLRPVHRAVLVLRDLEGLSIAEIATVTEMPEGSVKGRLHRARSELAELLRNNSYDWEVPR